MSTKNEKRSPFDQRLDDIEASLPDIPARMISLGRASVDRVASTANGIAGDVGRHLTRLSSTAGEAMSTTVGQTRSAADRTVTAARRNTKEAVGQAKAQTRRTGTASKRASTTLLDDATRAVDPDTDGRPAALEDWTKAALYERAQELDIDGRSAMSKAELVRAIRSS